MIRVLAVLSFYYPHRGGSQKYAEEIFAPMLRNHDDIQVDVLCYNTDKAPKIEKYRGTTIYRIPCWNVIPARFALPNPIALISILFKLSKNKYDFTVTHIRFFDPTWWLWFYSKLIHAQSIFTGHVPSHPIHQNKIVQTMAKLVDLTIATFSLKFYDHLIFVNKASEQFFKEKLGVKKQTNVIYIGVDTKEFKPRDKAYTTSLRYIPKTGKALTSNDILVTYVGRLIWTKGITYLYDAVKEVYKQPDTQNVYFVLAGPGELEQEIRTSIKADKLSDKVFLTGSINYDEVKSLLTSTDIFINPSHHNEGLPNTLLEAGACENFVIATDNGATKELIIDGQTGLLIPQKDKTAIKEALLKAIKNKELRFRLANNLLQKVRHEHDWETLSERFYQFLKGST